MRTVAKPRRRQSAQSSLSFQDPKTGCFHESACCRGIVGLKVSSGQQFQVRHNQPKQSSTNQQPMSINQGHAKIAKREMLQNVTGVDGLARFLWQWDSLHDISIFHIAGKSLLVLSVKSSNQGHTLEAKRG